MSTDREASFPIESFDGVNLNVDSEDVQPTELLLAQNLWEKTLGQLETRGGSETHAYKPSGVTQLGNIFKLYKSWGEKNRFCAIKCTPDSGVYATLPTGISLAFVDDSAAYWNNSHVFGATYDSGITLNMTPRRIVLRFVGFGIEKFYEVTTTAVSGYAATTNQKLEVTITSSFDNSKIKGIEIYATVDSGSTETVGTIDATSAYQEQSMWVGFIDVTTTVAQTKDFRYCPACYDSTIVGGTAIGSSERSFVVEAFESGINNVSGTFQGGKTYYVALLPQYTVFDSGSNSRCAYRNPTVDVFGGDVVPITIPGTTTGYIKINTIAPNTVCFLVAVGEHPQLLQPHSIFNDSAVGGGASTAPDIVVSGDFWIENPPANNPGVVNISYTADGIATLTYRFSDFSRQDMLMGINDDGTVYPIYCSRLFYTVNNDVATKDVLSDFTAAPSAASAFPWLWYSTNAMGLMQRMGDGAKYHFVQFDDYCLFVNDFDPLTLSASVIGGSAYSVMGSNTSTNYFITDGKIAAAVIQDYQATQVTLPNNKYISKFDSSIILGGGTPSIDPQNGGVNDSSKTVYFSRSGNPFDFTIAGAASTTHQTIAYDEGGENILGFGIYTNTTSQSGPQSEFIVVKKNATWIMNELPTTSSGSLGNFTNRLLSRKVGGFHRTFANTPIGTLMASHDNVYLLREDGEPTPMGQNISSLLKAADMSKAVACYHDKHYKLAFSHPDYSGYNAGASNNVEMWLNINKVIEKKGGEDWVGPMIGRAVDFVFVEDLDGDGETYDNARDRFSIDQNAGRIYKADVYPANTDDTIYDANSTVNASDTTAIVTSRIVTKDLDITSQDNNWNKLMKRFYVKLRSNWITPASGTNSASASYNVYVDGDAEGSVDFGSDVGDNGSASFYARPLRLVGLFPSSRLRGRTFRLDLTFTKRVGIGGLQLNYQIERRRI